MSDASCGCKDRQIAWANERSIPLQGSKGPRGVPAYTLTVDDNLFNGLSPSTRRELEASDGDELRSNGFTCKMQAVHSSAALAVNIFEYWRHRDACEPLGFALDSPHSIDSLQFEVQREIRSYFRTPPHLDIVATCDLSQPIREVAIESKFTEPYTGRDTSSRTVGDPYFYGDDLWAGIPRCRCLAEELNPKNDRFDFLDAAQLLKHILGLRSAYNWSNIGWTLLYLWYDVPGKEGEGHRNEIDQFAQIAADDDVPFSTMTHQELIRRLSQFRDGHEQYVDYLVSRYLE